MLFAAALVVACLQEFQLTTPGVPTTSVPVLATPSSSPASSRFHQYRDAGLKCVRAGLGMAWLILERSYWEKSPEQWSQSDWSGWSPPVGVLPASAFLVPEFEQLDKLEIRRVDWTSPTILISSFEDVRESTTVGLRAYYAVYRFDPTANLFSSGELKEWHALRTGFVFCNQRVKELLELRILPKVESSSGTRASAFGNQLQWRDRALPTRGNVVVLIQAIPGGNLAAVVSAGDYRAPGGFFGGPERFGNPYYLHIFDSASGELMLEPQEIPLPRGVEALRSCVISDGRFLVLATESPGAICFVSLVQFADP